MSASRPILDVRRLRRLSLGRHDHLRIDLITDTDVKPGDLLRGEYHGSLPLRGEIKQVGSAGDLVGTFWANLYATTSKLTDALDRLGLKGWGVMPILLTGPTAAVPALKLLTVTGRSGPIYGAGGIERPEIDPLGQYLDPRDWDGSDIFVPANSRAIMIVGDAADALQAEQLRDVELEPAALEPITSIS